GTRRYDHRGRWRRIGGAAGAARSHRQRVGGDRAGTRRSPGDGPRPGVAAGAPGGEPGRGRDERGGGSRPRPAGSDSGTGRAGGAHGRPASPGGQGVGGSLLSLAGVGRRAGGGWAPVRTRCGGEAVKDLMRLARNQWDRTSAWLLIAVGAIALIAGWVGVSATAFP